MRQMGESLIVLRKNIKVLLFKYASLFLIYFYFLILIKILLITYRITNYPFGFATCFFIFGASISFLYYKILVKKAYKVGVSVLFMLIFASFIIYEIKLGNLQSIILNIIEFTKIIYSGEKANFILFQPVVMLVIPLISMLFFSLDLRGKGEVIVFIVTVLVINAWFNGLNKENKAYIYLYIYLSILYLIINNCKKKNISLYNKKIRFSIQRNSIISYGVFFSALVLISGYFFVAIFGVQSASNIKDKIQNKLVKYREQGIKSTYTISKSGFGSDNKLGGPVVLNNDIAFRVKSDKIYYLRGVIKDNYSNNQWTNRNEQFFIKSNKAIYNPDSDYIKFMIGINAESKLDFNFNDLLPKTLRVYPEKIDSSTLFAPINTYNVKANNEQIGYTNNGIFMLLNKSFPRNYYTDSYYESKIGVENFLNSKEGKFSIDYETTNIKKDHTNEYDVGFNDKYLAYLDLPKNITERTYALVYDIIRDCTTTQEKVWKIYDYINQNYKYSLDVSIVPDDEEFLDYFLFTEKKGYCTYFATAATIFCRIAGVPARYVEGFRMNEDKDSNGLYIVANSGAHAWSEVLVSEKYNIWSTFDCVPEQNDTGLETFESFLDNPKINKWVKDNDNLIPDLIGESGINLSENKYYTEQIRIVNSNDRTMSVIKYLLFLFPVILLILIIIYIYIKVKRFVNYKNTILNGNSVIPLYNYAKKRLDLINIKCLPSTSELEFLKNIKDHELKNRLNEIVCLYHEEFYGEKKLPEFNKSAFYNFIENYLRKKQKVLNYYFKKYFNN